MKTNLFFSVLFLMIVSLETLMAQTYGVVAPTGSTVNYIPKFTTIANPIIISNSLFYDDGTNGLVGATGFMKVESQSQYGTFLGYQAGNSNGATSNVGLGYNALYTNSSGQKNTATGVHSLRANSSGSYNTANGYGALNANTASENTAVGFAALLYNTSGAYNTATGSNALYSNTTASYNTAIGYKSLYTQSYSNGSTVWNSYNVAIGYNALYSNQPTSTSNGISNTANGTAALYSNTTGSYNTAIGDGTLYYNTTASNNTANGRQSLFTNTTGANNTALGYQSGYSNSTGASNIFLGYQAGYSETGSNKLYIDNSNTATPLIWGDFSTNTVKIYSNLNINDVYTFPTTAGTNGYVMKTNGAGSVTWTDPASFGWSLTGNSGTTAGTNFIGTTDNVDVVIKRNNEQSGLLNTSYYNTSWGVGALKPTTTGYGNTAIGYQALYSNTSGSYNTAYGYQALYTNNTGTSNTAIGIQALNLNTTGSDNTANGVGALSYNTIGTSNTATGRMALFANTEGDDNVAMGNSALSGNTTGNNNIGIGVGTLYYNATGLDNTSIGYFAGWGASTVNFTQCTFVGSTTYPTVARTNVTMLGYGVANGQCTGNDQICLGNTSIAYIRAQVGSITTYSDARFKTNIKDNVAGLDFILKLKPVTYNEKPKELHKIWGTPDSLVNKIDHSEIEQMRFIGFLAQDVEKAATDCGFDFPGIDVPKNDKEVYSLRYGDFIMPLVKSVQELSQTIETLKANHKKTVDSLVTIMQNCCSQGKIQGTTNNSGSQEQSNTETRLQVDLTNNNQAILYQNEPNPFGGSTVIRYFVPEDVAGGIYIVFYDMYGKEFKKADIITKGFGNIDANTENLASGIYSYSLIINDKVIETKKMIKSK